MRHRPTQTALRHLIRFLPLALTAAGACSTAGAVEAYLQPGRWHYHADIHYTAGAMSNGNLHKDWTRCVDAAEANRPPSGMPATPNVKCDKPTLNVVGKAYHTVITCTAQTANGMTSTIHDDFTFTPTDDHRKITIDGTVHQTITGLPVAIPPSVMTMHTVGVRTGECKAGQ